MANTMPARGMRDFLPADIRKREYVVDIIRQVYESYGFEPLETPAAENIETLTGKYGDEGNQLIYRILKRGEKLEVGAAERDLADLALRYDLTVPFARVIANNRSKLPKFFKRYQIQPVWRADRPARGRFREFYQCDVDAIGSRSMAVEAEMITAVSEILNKLGFDDFVIRLNHREVLRDILDTAGVPAELHGDALIVIDKLDKIGPEGVQTEFIDRGIGEASSKMLLDIFEQTRLIAGEGVDVNRTIVSNLVNIVSNEVLSELGQILRFADKAPVQLDPSLARGLSYYTGAIMEVNVPDLGGSLAGGGRYDTLIGMFGKEQIPACGFSLGLERILVVMEEREMFPPAITASSAADLMVTIWNDATVDDSLKLAGKLRSQGLRVIVYPEPDKLSKQFKYASQLNVPFVCVLGDEETSQGKAKLKDMRSGEEFTLRPDAISGVIRAA
ncbi:MAG: histidine--tRNA ligase [Pyrinomonadaceae bacterium]